VADRRVIVDYGGSHLRPTRRGSCQRLGLGPPVTAGSEDGEAPPATLRLEPGQKKTLLVNTVCLDVHRSAPSEQAFVAEPKKLPAVRENALRWWVENPRAPQSAVNSAIWRNAKRVVVHEWGDAGREETIRKSAVHGGVYYQLRNHELTSLDPDGVRRVLGSEIRQVFPTDGAVYATMPGEDGNMDLWRLAPTGDNPWGFVADLDPAWELFDLIPAGSGNLVLLTDTGVRWLARKSRSSKQVIPLASAKHLSARVGARTGSVYVTTHTPADEGITRNGVLEGQRAQTFGLWRIDPNTGKSEKRDSFWNVAAIRAGPGGVFGLSPVGQLRRMTNGKFKDTQSTRTYASIVAVGRSRVWLLDQAGRLVAASTKSGHRLFKSDAKVGKETRFDWDPMTDDLSFTSRGAFHRVSAQDGTVATLPEAEPETE
jgi:hypothetical protein